MTQPDELLNCPFCGNKPEVYKTKEINKGYYKAIACPKCNFGIYRTTIKQALQDWNIRLNTRPPSPKMEQGKNMPICLYGHIEKETDFWITVHLPNSGTLYDFKKIDLFGQPSGEKT